MGSSKSIIQILKGNACFFATSSFYASKENRTCKNCGVVHPGKTPPAGWVDI
jgi:hypothetical protein